MPPVLLKETLVEIRRSLGRFLSILLIVAPVSYTHLTLPTIVGV